MTAGPWWESGERAAAADTDFIRIPEQRTGPSALERFWAGEDEQEEVESGE